MIAAPIGLDVIEPAYLALLRESDGPAWLKQVRDLGTTRWRVEGLPSKRLEKWRYTATSFLAEGNWISGDVLAEDELPLRIEFQSYQGEKSGEIALLNGVLVAAWSRLVIPGVRVSSAVENAATTFNDLEIDIASGSVFNALNASFLHDIVTIEIAPGTILKKPLVISQLALGSESLNEWTVACPRLKIKVGREADVALIEFFAGDGRYVHAPVVEIEVADGARLHHARVSLENQNAVHFGSAQLTLGRDAYCGTYQFSLLGRLLREDLSVKLASPGAEAVLDGLYVTSGRRLTDHVTSVEHFAPQTTSSQLYKGLLSEESRAVFNGRVHIHRAAQQSNAAQLNNNLLLSEKAEIDTKPELEIDADDVKASHGATIGQLDPDHIFYLQARAISKSNAVRMLSRGFAQDVAFRIENEAMKTGLRDVVDSALSVQEFEGLGHGI